MLKKSFILLITLVFGCAIMLQAQGRKKNRLQIFEGGVLAGFSLTQMDGDKFSGFDKTGIYAGIRGIVNFTPRISMNMELLYSEKGSKIPHGRRVNGREIRDRVIDLNYAEVPILFKFFLTPEKNSPFIEIGPSFSQLLRTNIIEKDPSYIEGTVFEEIALEFNSFDLNAIIGLGFRPHQRIETTLRYSYGLSKVYHDEDYYRPTSISHRSQTTREVDFLRNYQLTLLVSYRIK